MKFLLYIDILIAVIVLVKSDESSSRITRQSGYFYDKPKITFEEGNSLSDNKRIRITSSKKPIYTPSTESVIRNDLSFQGDRNNYRIPIISLDSNTEKNKGAGSVRDDFLQYQKSTAKSSQISNTKFPSTLNQFSQRVTTQRSELANNNFNRPSINEENKKITFNTGELQNGQHIQSKEVTLITPLPTVTSLTQSPFNVYNGGDNEKKINQETYITVKKKPFPPLKPTVTPVKTISFNDGASDFELDKTIGTNKIFTSYKPLPSLPSEVPTSQISIKQPQSPQTLNTISTERFEGYINSKPQKPTDISGQKLRPIQETPKSVLYKPTPIPLIPSTAQQPKQTISRVKSYKIPKLPSSQLPSYKIPQTSISVAPIFITNNITYTSSRTTSPRPFKIGFTEPSIKKPLSSQPLTYKTEVSVQRPSVKVAGTPAFFSQSPNYQIDRFSSIPKLPSYQTQKVIASKTPAEPGFQSQFYSPKTLKTGKLPLTQSFGGYVYETPNTPFEEKPSTNPLIKVPNFQSEKTKYPNAINTPYLQTSTFKPQTYAPSIPSSFHQFSKPSKQPFNLKPQQISDIKGPEITIFPNYKPFSGSQIPFQRPVFSTQIPFSTSTYRPTSLPQALKPIKTQSPTSYVYNKPKETSITTTFSESSPYKPSKSIFNSKLNQNTTPRVPYSYKGQQFQAAFKPLEISSFSRPLNKPSQFPSSDQSTKIPSTDEYFEISSLQSTQRPLTYEISRSPGYTPSQPILPYKPSQTKNQYKPFQTHIQDRPTQKSTFKSPEIPSSPTPTYQPEKIAPQVTFTKPTQTFNYPQTQISNEVIKTTISIEPPQGLPSFPKTQNSPSPLYKQSSISPHFEPKTISTYQSQRTFSNTKQPQISTTPNPIKSSFNQQNGKPFYKPSITQSFNRPIPIPHIHEVSKVSQPHKFPSFSVPSEPPINILAKPILSPEPFLPNISSSPKPPNPYTAPLSRYPPNKLIFQGPAYIPPLESSSQKPIIYKPSSFKPFIPARTTEKTSINAISTYKPYFSTSATRKPIINATSTYKIPVSSENPYTSFNNIPYRPIISTEKPLLYQPSTYETKLSFGTTKTPFKYTGSTFKPYVPVKISQKPYLYETSSVRPFITTTKIKEPFTSTFNNFEPYIPNKTTEKHFSYESSTSKPFVIASTTKKPSIYTYSTKKPNLSEITQKPFIYGIPEYKPKPFISINDTDKTFDQAFSTRKPYMSFTTTHKPQTYAPSPYVPTSRKPFTIAPSSKPFVLVTSSQQPVTYSTYTYKPSVPVRVTQKPYFPVDSTTQSLIYTPSTRKQYISSNKSEKPFTYATPIYKPFVPVDQNREPSTLKPYKTISTTKKPSSYKTSSPYKPFISISETKSTTAKPLAYTPSSSRPFIAVSSTRKLFTGIPESTTQKPFTYTIASTYEPFVTVSKKQKPSTYAPFSRKPATSTQKSLFYSSSLVPVIETSTTQKPFTYATSSYQPFTTSRITYKPFEPIYTTQKSITKKLKAEDKSTSQSIFRTTAFGVPTRRPSTQNEDRGYLPPQPEGYFYPKPKIPFNSK